MKYVSFSDARRHLTQLVDQVERTIVIRNNKPVAAILHMDDYEALLGAQARERDPQRQLDLLHAQREVKRQTPGARIEFSEGDVDELLALAETEAGHEPA